MKLKKKISYKRKIIFGEETEFPYIFMVSFKSAYFEWQTAYISKYCVRYIFNRFVQSDSFTSFKCNVYFLFTRFFAVFGVHSFSYYSMFLLFVDKKQIECIVE